MNPKKFVVPLALGLLACMLCCVPLMMHETPQVSQSPTPADTAAIVQPQATPQPRERIVDLPNDGQQYFVTLFVHKDWRARHADRHLVACWQSIPELQSIRAQVHFNTFAEGDRAYEDRMKLLLARPTLPSILVQASDGKVIYRESGETLPQSSGEWTATAGKIFGGRAILPWNAEKRTCPNTTPAPPPQPAPVITTVTIPDRVGPPPAKEEPFPWLLLAAVCGISAVVAFIVQFKKEAGQSA